MLYQPGYRSFVAPYARLRWWSRRAVLGLLIIVMLSAPAAYAAGPCVSVEINDDAADYYDCLNSDLQAQVSQSEKRRSQLKIIQQNSRPQTDTEMGLYNNAATRMRMGGNLGNSAFPQRPTRTFNSPLLQGR